MKYKISSLLIFYLLYADFAQAQLIANLEIIKGSLNDAEKIANAYLHPLEKSMNAIGSAGSVCVFNSASDKFTFQIGINANIVFAPASAKNFNVSELGLEEFKAADQSGNLAQTFSGNNTVITLESNTRYRVPQAAFPFYREVPVLSISSIEGQLSPLLAPVIDIKMSSKQLTLTVRGLPSVKLSDKTIGIGIIGVYMHYEAITLKTGISEKPLRLQLIAGGQYARIAYYPGIIPDETKTGLSLQSNNGPYNNQALIIRTYSFPIKAILLQELKKMTAYAGIGYSYEASNVELTGKYPVYYADQGNTFKLIVKDFEDPFQYQRKGSRLSIDAGIARRISSIDISAGFSLSKYSTLQLGASFRLLTSN